MHPLIGSDETEQVQIKLAGRQEQPDFPKPHLKWFSQLCLGCFLSSKDTSLPAILKIAQERINSVISNNEIMQQDFHEQPIQVKEDYVKFSTEDKFDLVLEEVGL